MRDCQCRTIICPDAAGPQYYVQIEHARSPALTAPFATEMCFHFVQATEQSRRIKRSRDYNCGVGVCALRGADCGAVNNRRLRENVDIWHLKRGYCFAQYKCWRADLAVSLVRTKGDEIQIGQLTILGQPAIKFRPAVAEEAHAGAVGAGLIKVEGCDQ